MKNYQNNNEAWTQGFMDGCMDVKGTYTGVPSIPNLQIKPGENSLEVYYKDGHEKGELYALQTLSGNNKSLRN
ncbi:hypothetical protein [Polynucleobacter sphagniphilus]|jgi:hypothetical protein|uniref:Uncharacterized protein n=1 Tax=Polynucleobacter sphagniphilus TaxID=1743169 RepID=A0AA43S5W5_9BURK|nr:hypothetical protein [Polynucleobacter sphagniphilus]MDH6504999.1 hypothetical protein [Polynucleobacter sphagniphilus]MDH6513526.1 hypothetical protein [Polynucleobacter sphagniphilus]